MNKTARLSGATAAQWLAPPFSVGWEKLLILLPRKFYCIFIIKQAFFYCNKGKIPRLVREIVAAEKQVNGYELKIDRDCEKFLTVS